MRALEVRLAAVDSLLLTPPKAGFAILWLHLGYQARDTFAAGAFGLIAGSHHFHTDAAGEPKLEEAEPFENGLARVKKDGHWGYIDRQGISIWQAE
jgi:hypothetical protein